MDLGLEGGFKVHPKSVNERLNPDWISSVDKNGWVLLKETGIKTIFANDILHSAHRAWTTYFSRRGTNKDFFKIGSIVDFVKREQIEEFFPRNIDIVTGGFPCQDFSIAGKRKGFTSHKNHNGKILTESDNPTTENRGKLYVWMKEVIEITQPKIFIAENVKGLVNLQDVKNIIVNDFRNIGGNGYIVLNPRVLSAHNFGVPQRRERVIFIGLRKDLLSVEQLDLIQHVSTDLDIYPSATHRSPAKELLDDMKPWVTVGDILKDLEEPEESNDLTHKSYSRAKYMGAHCQGQTEVDLSMPSPTIRSEHHGNIEFRRLSASHGGTHKDEFEKGLKERRLSVRECARIQTFPDDYDFVIPGENSRQFFINSSDAYKLIGNAVPPLLAYHLANSILRKWNVLFKG